MRLIAFAILALALAGCKNKTTTHFERVAAELPAAEAAARKAGLPLHSRELAPPELKPEDNAAPLLAKASKLLREVRLPERRDLWALAFPKSDSGARELRDLMRKAEPALQLLSQAAARKGVNFGRDWNTDRSWAMAFPEYSELRNHAKWTAARAVVAAREGDKSRALREIRTGLRMGEFAGSEPTLIGGLVQVALDNISFRQIEHVVTLQNDARFLGEVRGLLRKSIWRNDVWFHIQAEVVFAGSVIKLLSEGGSEELMNLMAEETPKDYVPDGVSRDLAAKSYRTRVLQHWTEVATKLQATSDLRAQAKVLTDADNKRIDDSDLTNQYFALFEPRFGQFGQAVLKREAVRIALDGMLAALEYRARKGRFPITLAEAGFTTRDPFSEQPLKMRATKDSISVWSVGTNLKNDGGEENQVLDLVARYPRIPR